MITSIHDMPPGTLGFHLTDDLERKDYVDVLVPAIKGCIDRGEKIRLLFEIGRDFDDIEAGAAWEDAKTGVQLGLGNHSSWERVALVTDVEWMRRGMKLFGWMAPGEMQVFGLAEGAAARAWVAGQAAS